MLIFLTYFLFCRLAKRRNAILKQRKKADKDIVDVPPAPPAFCPPPTALDAPLPGGGQLANHIFSIVSTSFPHFALTISHESFLKACGVLPQAGDAPVLAIEAPAEIQPDDEAEVAVEDDDVEREWGKDDAPAAESFIMSSVKKGNRPGKPIAQVSSIVGEVRFLFSYVFVLLFFIRKQSKQESSCK